MYEDPGRTIIDQYIRALKQKTGKNRHHEIILLESQQGDSSAGDVSLIAAFPKRLISGKGTKITTSVNGVTKEFNSDPWKAIQEFRKKNNSWLFGYFGYDLKNSIEDLSSQNQELYESADFYLMEPSVLIQISDDKADIIFGDELELDQTEKVNSFSLGKLISGVSKNRYIETVKEIQKQIKEGDFYELNFSYPIQADFDGEPYELYRAMRNINPVPFGAYLELNDKQICSSSPERFLQKKGDTILSEPIKGTSARSTSEVEDEDFKKLLLNDKNRAENLMIVDLVRHDFSKVCKTGSVTVQKLFDIRTFETVHQMISRIEGELYADQNSISALKACFPMGSMTGAPKIKVMQEIEHYENYRRGIYSGAIGYITPDDDMDFSVVIRTAIVQNGELTYPVGGAITSDSDPEEEWEETKLKAQTIIRCGCS